MAHATKRLLLLLATITLAGCATTSALRSGENAEAAQDYDRAIVEYTRALQVNPDNRSARQGLERSTLRAAQEHYTRGRRFHAGGRLNEALVELQLAAELNPNDATVLQLLETVRAEVRAGVAVARDGKTQLETLIERSQNLQPPGFDLPADLRLPTALTFRDASTRDVYTALARMANVNIVFDPQFRDQPVTIDLRNALFTDALASLSTATRNFYRVTAQRTITVIPDTPAKRTEYEEEIVRTFYLSNADVKETLDLLRIVIDNRRLAPITATNALSIKDTPERVAAAGSLIAAIDKARPEVVIDVELLEFDRTRLREYGLQLASPGSPGINGQADVNREGFTLRDLQQPQHVRCLPDERAGLVLSPAEGRQQHADAGQHAAADVGRHAGAGAVRRAGAGTGHDVLADRDRRRRAAADHVVQLREHRRQHRHHAAHASRRPGVAGAEDSRQQHFRYRVRWAAHLRQSRDQHGDSPAGRRDEPAGGPHPRQRAPRARRRPGAERHSARRPAVRAQPPRDAGIGHRPDADAADRPRART